MVKVENLIKNYGTVPALKGISFNVKQGEIIGLLGPNGAGKTTTMRILSGFMPASSGTAEINGLEIHENPLAAKKMIGYLPENPPLYTEMRVKDYLVFTAELKGVERKKIPGRLDYVLESAGLKDRRNYIIGKLSKGYRQRVGIAMALINDPALMILDEPTIGLDPNQIIEIRSLIKNLAGSRTIILSTHILPEVSQTCQRVIIIAQGQIAAQDTHEGLQKLASGKTRIILKTQGRQNDACSLVMRIPGVNDAVIKNDYIEITADSGVTITPEIARILVNSAIDIIELKTEIATLEEIFHKITLEEKL
ncbi:MAG: hypothetical protein A2096_05860 [Spirochaetes bacterium GWF1_41_5]|nr:MAG: hypothetical protein A2096_05860 [Spirochaetes bacterium GWF1_41_5]HBE01697.1 MFS transporter [Spirochaetia bacterium]